MSVFFMSTVQEIESAIEKLPEKKVKELGLWFNEYQARLWDQEIKKDAENGKLDFLVKEAHEEHEQGTLRQFP